jgi:hypothetical protein
MLCIRRNAATGAAVFDYQLQGSPGRSTCCEPRAPVPRLTQPWLVPFREWCERYEYFVACMMQCVHARLGSQHDTRLVDWAGMRAALQRHLYRTSANRYRRFVLLK